MAISQDGKRLSVEQGDGLSIAQVAQCLVRSTQDLGQLCGDITWDSTNQQWVIVNSGNGAINKWAKYKPYQANTLTTHGDAARGGFPYYWGMGFPVLTAPFVSGQKIYSYYENDLETVTDSRMNGWVYNRPRGVSQSPKEYFRLLDFDGYYHGANVPLRFSGGTASVAVGAKQFYSALFNENPDSAELTLANFTSNNHALNTYYFCIIGVREVNGTIDESNRFFVVSASSPISDSLFGVQIDYRGSNFAGFLGTYHLYPCLCSVSNQGVYPASPLPLIDAKYITLPCSKPLVVTVAQKLYRADLSGTKNTTTSVISYAYTVYNEDSTAKTFTGMTLWVLHAGHTPTGGSLESDERQISLSDVTVQGRSDSGEITGTITSVPSSLLADANLWLTCSSGFDRVGPIGLPYPVSE